MSVNDVKSRNILPARLKGDAQHNRVFRYGKRYKSSFMQMIVCKTQNNAEGRIGFVISKKAVRTAVKRNRVRRFVKEAVRHWWKYLSDPVSSNSAVKTV